MANRIEPFEVTIPAGTAKASFQRTDLPMNEGRVDLIQVRIPPGPSGNVGFRIAHSGQSVIPYTDERWFVTDDDKLDWATERYPQGDAWQLWAYNTDIYDHTVYVWMHVTDAIGSPVVTVTPLTIQPIMLSDHEPTTEELS